MTSPDAAVRRDPRAPVLLLSIRTEPLAAQEESRDFARFLEIDPERLVRRELGTAPLGDIRLEDWSAIVLGGGSFTASDPEESKSAEQHLAEKDLARLLDDVVAADFPFLGACYGVGALGTHQGARIDRSYPEPVGALSVTLTDDGADDPVLAGLPREFAAYGGHKEAVSELPPHAVRLATSDACPVQAFRIGSNGYAFQFHPELDLDGLRTRISVYAHYGYFDPSEVGRLHAEAAEVEVRHPMRILANFAERYLR